MRAQHVYDNVVLPFLDAIRRAGIPVNTMARIVGVSRSTIYFWGIKKYMPDEARQEILVALTEIINAKIEKGDLPFSLNSDDTVRQLLGIDRT